MSSGVEGISLASLFLRGGWIASIRRSTILEKNDLAPARLCLLYTFGEEAKAELRWSDTVGGTSLVFGVYGTKCSNGDGTGANCLEAGDRTLNRNRYGGVAIPGDGKPFSRMSIAFWERPGLYSWFGLEEDAMEDWLSRLAEHPVPSARERDMALGMKDM